MPDYRETAAGLPLRPLGSLPLPDDDDSQHMKRRMSKGSKRHLKRAMKKGNRAKR